VTRAIVDAGAGSVVGVDRSEAYLTFARRRVAHPCARFEVGDLAMLPLAAASVDAAASAFVLNFLPDPAAGLAEMRRVVRPGGVVACWVWDYADGMELLSTFWDAAGAVDSAAREHDERPRFAGICGARQLTALFDDGGMRGVVAQDFSVFAHFDSADDAWRPFLGGQGPAPTYLASLDGAARAHVHDEFVLRLPESLLLRAIAVKGRTPS
jgi:SAM-dependent methyltransferase